MATTTQVYQNDLFSLFYHWIYFPRIPSDRFLNRRLETNDSFRLRRAFPLRPNTPVPMGTRVVSRLNSYHIIRLFYLYCAVVKIATMIEYFQRYLFSSFYPCVWFFRNPFPNILKSAPCNPRRFPVESGFSRRATRPGSGGHSRGPVGIFPSGSHCFDFCSLWLKWGP
jgi:hypothetical protein